MKNPYFILTIVLLFSLILFPLAALPPSAESTEPPSDIADLPEYAEKIDKFDVYNHETGKVEEMSAETYVFGVVACEMSPENEEEALKAQAVAAYTFACRKRLQRIKSASAPVVSETASADPSSADPSAIPSIGSSTASSDGGSSVSAESVGESPVISSAAETANTPEKKEYDVTTNSQLDQGYLSRAAAIAKWGDKGEEYAKKLDKIVSAVKGCLITYENAPIFAAYHAVSAGKTESAKNMWGSEYAYLQPVESVGDLLCPSYLSEVKLSAADFKKVLTDKLKISPEGDGSANWLSEPARSQSGTVLTYKVCGTEVTGKDMRTAFGLRSPNFDLVFADNQFVFTVRGYGHGVGMSQYGANYMALQGSTYLEILSWYYPDCQLAVSSKS